MKLSQYNFTLPPDLIAKHPALNRDEARLFVLHRKTGKAEHRTFYDLLGYFAEGDVIVLNDTKVFPARMVGYKEKTNARIEVLLMRELNTETFLWDVLVDPARKIRTGNKIYFGNDDLIAEIVDNTTSRGRTLRFLYDGTHNRLKHLIEKIGEPPIPKYLKRESTPDDRTYYQTIYAREEGSIAPPYAGLHFSAALLKRMEIKGIKITEITHHLGLGSFKQIDVEDLTKHRTSSELIRVSEASAEIINEAKVANRSICAVGTTVFRTMETRATTMKTVAPCEEDWTSKFFFPPYAAKVPTHLITNLHLPRSMMMMTVSAFAGYDMLMDAYRKAIREKYRFGAYGDAMLIMD